MRFSVSLPTERVDRASEFVTQQAVAEIAAAAEDAGFDACFVTDHPFPPHRWLYGGGHHALDPFVALSFAAAAFAALGADFDAREAVSDEMIRAIKLAWAGDDVRFEGRSFQAGGNSMGFRPVQQPHPPIWVGGNSRSAIRRAVELGDGWVPFPNPAGMAKYTRTPAIETLDDLKARLAFARAHSMEIGRREPFDVCYSLVRMGAATLDTGEARERVAALQEVGVTWLTVGFPGDRRHEYVAALERFARDVMV
jgi:alkanesulfonate monooxygenase SsuD/methylene tetrahydromethanopterin reductase-like flavin-dependent oxidoreductase (luciferase family)